MNTNDENTGYSSDEGCELTRTTSVYVPPKESEAPKVSGTQGASGTQGVSEAQGASGTQGVSEAQGVSGTQGVSEAQRVSEPTGIERDFVNSVKKNLQSNMDSANSAAVDVWATQGTSGLLNHIMTDDNGNQISYAESRARYG